MNPGLQFILINDSVILFSSKINLFDRKEIQNRGYQLIDSRIGLTTIIIFIFTHFFLSCPGEILKTLHP